MVLLKPSTSELMRSFLLVVLTDCYHFGKQICGLWIPLDAQAFQGSISLIYLQLLSA